MKKIILMASMALLTASPAWADKYSDALENFRNAGESRKFLDTAYAYALFPTVGKGGIVVGAAYGEGRVYQGGKVIGTAKLTQASIGFQLGGQAYSQIIFFKDARALKEFTTTGFEFGADASAVIITAGATATAGTKGAAAGAGTSKKDSDNAGTWFKGMAVFTIIKGGAMYELSLAGQKFTYQAGGG
jgi:lipid-binding SYLF domain-containing protein